MSAAWPSQGLQALDLVLTLTAAGAIAAILGARLAAGWATIAAPEPSKPAWCARLYIFLVFVSSAAFVNSAALLRFGVGLPTSHAACDAAIIVCVLFYVGSKVLLGLFFSERQYIVSGRVGPRRKSWRYLLQTALVLHGIPVIVANVVGRISILGDTGTCVIGLHLASAVPLVVWDGVTTTYIAVSFSAQLLRGHFVDAPTRKLAIASLLCSVVATSTSIANIVTLIALNGEEGWLCTLLCATDICANSIVLALTTRPIVERARSAASRRAGGQHAETATFSRQHFIVYDDEEPKAVAIPLSPRSVSHFVPTLEKHDGDKPDAVHADLDEHEIVS